MDDRTQIAALAMQGILIGVFSERPNAKPTPEKVAIHALDYADALLAAIRAAPRAPTDIIE